MEIKGLFGNIFEKNAQKTIFENNFYEQKSIWKLEMFPTCFLCFQIYIKNNFYLYCFSIILHLHIIIF